MAPSLESVVHNDAPPFSTPPKAGWLSGVRDRLVLLQGFSGARTLLLVAAIVRTWAAIWDQGMVWPDEIFQTLEQAHRFAFGWGIVPWEFRDGARSWLYPGLVGLIWKAASALGVTHGLSLVRIAKVGMAAVSVGAVWAGMRLAKHLGGKRAELLAALFGALCPPIVIFASRCTTEMASAALIVGAALLLEATPSRRRAGLAGAFAALAVLCRYQNGLVAAGFFFVLCARRRWGEVLSFVGVAIVVAGLGGALDWVTWGSPFHPLVVYWKFTFAAGGPGHGGSRWGDAPASFFSDRLAALTGLPTYSLLLLGLGVAWRRARGLVSIVVFFMLAHCAVPHKELRFITPILPLALALAAVGLADLADGLKRRAWPTYILCALCGAQMMWQLRAPKLRDVGYGEGDEVVWHANEDFYRASLDAAANADLCGITYLDTARAWTSGYTYLHRAVPVFYDAQPRNLVAANYAVGPHDERLPPEWQLVRTYGKFSLYRRDGTCGPTPADWSMNML